MHTGQTIRVNFKFTQVPVFHGETKGGLYKMQLESILSVLSRWQMNMIWYTQTKFIIKAKKTSTATKHLHKFPHIPRICSNAFFSERYGETTKNWI